MNEMLILIRVPGTFKKKDAQYMLVKNAIRVITVLYCYKNSIVMKIL